MHHERFTAELTDAAGSEWLRSSIINVLMAGQTQKLRTEGIRLRNVLTHVAFDACRSTGGTFSPPVLRASWPSSVSLTTLPHRIVIAPPRPNPRVCPCGHRIGNTATAVASLPPAFHHTSAKAVQLPPGLCVHVGVAMPKPTLSATVAMHAGPASYPTHR
jgi:hypothetical protein